MSDKLQQAIALIKAGDRKNGGQLLVAILKAEPDNEYAWVWMSRIVSNDEHLLILNRLYSPSTASELLYALNFVTTGTYTI